MARARHWGLALLLACCGPATGAPTELVIATWGGAYEAAQRAALFAPFTEATGIAIRTVAYDGGPDILGAEKPDLVDMAMSEAIAQCEAGRLRPLPHGDLPDGADGTPARSDFLKDTMQRCALTHTIYATVLAYDSRAFPGRPPTRIGDLFDTEHFPGPRALRRAPAAKLEWALMASGVPRREIYNLLSTDRGLDLAFERLERLRDDLVWWQDGAEPVALLESGRAVMASGYNGRFFSARLSGDSPIEIIWDGQIQEHQTWVIPRGAEHPEAAWAFVRFATGTPALTAFAERIAYGPARASAARLVRRHPEAGIDMRPHIPTHPYNSRNAIAMDEAWYARTLDRIRHRFEAWVGE